MINEYLIKFHRWYDRRITRERIFVIGLCWVLLYALFSLFLYHPLEIQAQTLKEEIKQGRFQISNWKKQINTLKQIAENPLYQEWIKQRKSIHNLQGQYKFLLKSSSDKAWQDVIKVILKSQSNVTLDEMKNFPETLYNPTNEQTSIKIYQQKLSVIVLSNYFDTINYLQRLEKILPNIHWDRLDYKVTQYPLAQVNMEFSILYEKSNS